MNWLDIVIIILIAVPTVIGLKIGIVKALFTVVGGIIGVILAGRFSGSLGEMMTFISDPALAKVAAFAVILIVVFWAMKQQRGSIGYGNIVQLIWQNSDCRL